MTTTDQQSGPTTNGSGYRPDQPKDNPGKEYGETGVTLTAEARRLTDDWVDWYYPSGKIKRSEVIQEMLELAHDLAAADQQRAERSADRRARLGKSRQ